MKKFNVGIITYDCKHLKTEQLVFRLINDARIESIILFALPFVQRKERKVIISHRPQMIKSINTQSLSMLENVYFQSWDGKKIYMMNVIFLL